MSNVEQGMSNVERDCGARGISTSKFDIPCSIFDIHVFFLSAPFRTPMERMMMQGRAEQKQKHVALHRTVAYLMQRIFADLRKAFAC